MAGAALYFYFDELSKKQQDSYDLGDVAHRPLLRQDLGTYAIPFYGESSSLFYRKDLFEKAGIEMPERPTWEQVTGFAKELNGIEDGVAGIALRGLPGWGANMGPFMTFMNTYGARWYKENGSRSSRRPRSRTPSSPT